MTPEQQPDPILVSVTTAGTMLGMSRPTIYKLLNSGALRAVRSGGRTLIPTQALRDYAEGLSPYSPAALDEGKVQAPLAEATRSANRLLRFKAVMTRTGLSRQQLFVRRTAGTFPPGVTLSRGVLAWKQSDVDAWIADPAGYKAKA